MHFVASEVLRSLRTVISMTDNDTIILFFVELMLKFLAIETYDVLYFRFQNMYDLNRDMMFCDIFKQNLSLQVFTFIT